MQYGDEKKGKLEKLEKKLYSRNAPEIINGQRSSIENPKEDFYEEEEIKGSWQDAKKSSFDELASKMAKMAQNKHRFVRKIFVVSLIFFILAAGVTAFVFLGGINLVSSRNVDIKVVGPLSVGSGQEVSLDINVINNNNIDLNSASLLVEYPDGTRLSSDLSKEIYEDRFSLNEVRPGGSYTQNIKVVFFGDKGAVKQIKISLEYRVENSSALFYKEKLHEISISSAPVILTPTYPKEVNSNQNVSFNIEIASNSKDSIDNFLVNVEYPFGFVFKDATPAASFGNNVWRLSSLASGEKRNIAIRGSIIGQDNEERVFKISTGVPNEEDERIISIPFAELTESILVKKPFIGLGVLIEGKNGDYAAQNGSQVATELSVRNNLPSRLFNVSVEVALKGAAFNRQGVFPQDGGFFQSYNDTILWDKRSESGLSDMEPGYEKRLAFQLSPLPFASIKTGERPEIVMTITSRGERVLESGSVEQVTSVETRKIVLTSNLSLSSRVVRSIGNLENSGPIPPRADTPTTYTVIWSAVNSLNQVSNVEVRATLPPYVKWTNLKNPQSEILTYNQVTNELVWNAGSMLSNAKKEIYFQLEFLPSLSQVGQSPSLLGETTLSGIDKVTGLKINSKSGAVTTNFSGDPTFRIGDDKVVQ